MKAERVLWGIMALVAGGFLACATPAVVFISPDYHTQPIKRVALLDFADFPGQGGSGALVADVFEKYLINSPYQVIERQQADQILQAQQVSLSGSADTIQAAAAGKALNVDGLIFGSLSEFSDTSEHTVMVDMPQEDTEPVYQDVLVQGRRGGVHTVAEQTGTQTTFTDQVVPETETLPARVGLSVRLVSVKTGAVLWSGSDSGDGMDISSAAENAASKLMQAIQKKLQEPQKQ